MLPVTKTAISASLISHTGVSSQATNREKKDGTLELNHESLIMRNRAKQGSFASSHAFEQQHGLLARVRACMQANIATHSVLSNDSIYKPLLLCIRNRLCLSVMHGILRATRNFPTHPRSSHTYTHTHKRAQAHMQRWEDAPSSLRP